MESIVRNDPDLFASPPDDEHQQVKPTGAAENSQPPEKANGKHSVSSESGNQRG
jgi:hypothetical protein